MKPFWLLLAPASILVLIWATAAHGEGPYAVTVSSPCVKFGDVTLTTNPPHTPCLEYRTRYHVGDQATWDKDEAEDLVYVLNQAHAQRTGQSLTNDELYELIREHEEVDKMREAKP